MLYKVKKDWKCWYVEYWKESKWKDKVIFDDVREIKVKNWKIVYKAEKDWKKRYVEFLRENEIVKF